MEYQEFIRSKQRTIKPMGFEVDKDRLNERLFPWQRDVVQWSVRRGRAALFEECGLGKTLQQLAWAERVHEKTKRPVVVHTPVGVRAQTKQEATKFGIACNVEVVNEQAEIIDGINLVNYEKLKRFDTSVFSGVVLDESSILKNFTGSTKRMLCEAYSATPYRLACTATPAPNDHKELGNHADFLGIMPSNEMLSRWFINDTMKAGGYRLIKHAEKDFWSWVASWAVCISKPSDIGGDDTGFDLPPLEVVRHIVQPDEDDAPSGFLFNVSGLSATNVHEAKRLSCHARARKTKEIAESVEGPCLIWCDTDYDADAVMEILDAVEVKGSHKESVKQDRLQGFADGKYLRLVTKPSVAGFGMNWQHCSTMIFCGLSFSFEAFYQAIRRCWRFLQLHPVTAHLILADTEYALEATIARKENDHKLMQTGMAEAMREATLEQLGIERRRDLYAPTKELTLPAWMKGIA